MKRTLLLFLISTSCIVSFSQTDRYWKGYGSSDNISDGSNWFNGNPSSGDNLYFNNTGGDCANTGRKFAYSNYGLGSYFNFIIFYNCSGGIKWYGDNTYALKFENNSENNSCEFANTEIGNRINNDLEINPVGNGGILVSGSTLSMDCNSNGNRILKVYGSKTLTINSGIYEKNTSSGLYSVALQLMSGGATVILNGANTFKGLTTINSGTLRLNRTGGTTIPITNNVTIGSTGTLRISTNQTLANLDLSAGGNLTVDAGATLTITGTYTPGTGTINCLGTIVIQSNTSFPGTSTIINNGTANTISNLTIDNATGVTINKALTVSGTLTVNASKTLITGVAITSPTSNIAGTIQLNNGGSISAAPTYSGTGSALVYNQGGSVNTSNEWSNTTTTVGAGVPQNVTLQNNTTLTTASARGLTGTLTVGSGSTMVLGGLYTGTSTISGTLQLNSSGSVSAAPTYSGTSSTLIYNQGSSLSTSNEWNGTSATVGAGVPQNVTILNGSIISIGGNRGITGALTLTSGKLAVGGNTLTLNGTVASMTATNSLSTTTSSNITIGGTGTLGTLYFDASNNSLNNLTINRTSTGLVTLGNALKLSGVVTPTAGQLVTGGFLTLVSTTTTGGGAIANASANSGNASNYISGNVTVQRFTQAQRGYRTFGNPLNSALQLSQLTDNFQITGLTVANAGTYGIGTGNPSAFTYNPTAIAPASPLTAVRDATASSWGAGKGLYVFVRGNGHEGSSNSYSAGTDVNFNITRPAGISSVTIDVNGTVNQGQTDVAVDYSATSGANNYNLIANPYPSPIDLNNVVMSDGSSFYSKYGTVYTYNPLAGVASNTVAVGGFTTTGTAGNPSIIIPSMGAFYVLATAANTIRFQEAAKTTTAPNLSLFGTGAATPRFKLNISSGNVSFDDLQVGYNNTSTSLAGDFYDAPKLNNTVLDFYTLAADNKSLAIDYRATGSTDIIALGIKTSAINNYTISLSELTDLPNIQLVLRDKLLNKETVLSQVGDSYSFDITADATTQGDNRFEIGLLGTTVLPVQIADITAQLQTNKIVAVNWKSTTEVNLANYKVQRSKDGTNYSTIGTVAAKGASAYSYSDDLSTLGVLPSTIYYRLEAVEKDGSKTYSKITSCQLPVNKTAISIYPNPVQSTLFAQVTVTKAGAAQLQVIDVQGKVVVTQNTQLTVGTSSISIPTAQLATGSYILEINSADGKQQQRFIKK